MPKYKIVWSDESILTLEKIMDYIFEEWGIQTIVDLQLKLDRLIHLLTTNKKLCPKSKVINVRICVVSEQISMVYKIEHSHLEIVTVIDNRSKHGY